MKSPSFVDYIREFTDSMAPEYRRRYDARSIVDHARLSYRRGSARVAVGSFRSTRAGMPLCIVADDSPGLLSLIAAACVVSRLEVTDAEALTRTRADGRVEAVDLLWAHPSGERGDNVWIAPSDVAGLRSALVVLMDGTFDRRTLVEHFCGATDPAGFGRTRVRVVEGSRGALEALEVETLDRPGLLFALTDVLFQLRLQIVRSEIRTVGSRVFDRFYFFDDRGAPVPARRAGEICQAVYARLLPRRRRGASVRAEGLSVHVE